MANVTRTVYKNRKAWLAGRKNGLGASDCGSVLNCGFNTPLQLWKEKTGLSAHKDISGNERVQFGNDAEDALRALFRVMHPEYELTFEPYLVLRQEGEYSFMSCTPDGELLEIETGRKGLYESKTVLCQSAKDWEEWNGKIKQGYFCQICHAMFVGDYQFAVVFALLRNKDGDAVIRAYKFERSDCADDISYIVKQEKEFWTCVENKTMPKISLSI